MIENLQNLIKLIQENPDLPVVPMVDCDVVGDNWCRWVGSIGRSYVSNYALFDDRYFEDDREGFIEAYYNSYDEEIDKMFDYHPEWELPNKSENVTVDQIEQNYINSQKIDEYLEQMADKYFTDAIIVHINPPEV